MTDLTVLPENRENVAIEGRRSMCFLRGTVCCDTNCGEQRRDKHTEHRDNADCRRTLHANIFSRKLSHLWRVNGDWTKKTAKCLLGELHAGNGAGDHILLNLYQIVFRNRHSEDRVEFAAMRHEHDRSRPILLVNAAAEAPFDGLNS